MGIPGDIQNELINALRYAFPDKQKLKMMLKLKLNFTLTIDSNDISEILFELIENNQVEINLLIRGALRSNPNNREIQDFVRNHIQFLVLNTEEVIKKKLTNDLILILEGINNFGYVVNALKKNLPERRQSYISEDIKNLDNQRIDKSSKIFLILEILFKDYIYTSDVENQKILLIFVFIADLLTNTHDRQLQQKLENWQNEAKRQGYQLPIAESDPGNDDREDTCTWQPYLSIVIKKLSSPDPDRYSLLGYLILENTADLAQIELIPLQNYIANEPKNKKNIEIVNYNSAKQYNFSFSQAKTEEGKKIIAKQLGLLIDESYEKIRARKLDINNSNEDDYRRDLVIEFFLPGQYFFEPVDSWQIPYGVFGDCTTKISRQYNVIIRSYDRLIKPRLMTILEKSWSKINETINNLSENLTEVELVDYYKKNYARLTKMTGVKSLLSKEIKEKIALTLICKPPPSSQICKILINEILEKGLPIIVWAKCQDNPENKLFSNFEPFFAPNLIYNLGDLSTLVHQKRSEAFDAFEEQVNEINQDEINDETNQLVEQPDPNEYFYSYLTIYFEETNRLSKLHDHLKENIDNNKLRLGT